MSSYGPGREARAQPAAPGGRFPCCGGQRPRRDKQREGRCRARADAGTEKQ